MTFEMRCSKCGSSNIHMEQDGQIKVGERYRANPVLHCYHCGLIVYGEEKVQHELSKQKEAFDARLASDAHQREQAILEKKREELRALREAMNPLLERHRTSSKVSKKAASYARPGVNVSGHALPSRPSSLAQSGSASKNSTSEQMPVSEDQLCAWIQCDKGVGGGRALRRKNSKYCSRQCSNKNARSRFRSRKGTSDDER